MASNIRFTKIEKDLEAEMKRQNNKLTQDWLSMKTKELEHRQRYSTGGDTQILQGALRILDDITDILKD